MPTHLPNVECPKCQHVFRVTRSKHYFTVKEAYRSGVKMEQTLCGVPLARDTAVSLRSNGEKATCRTCLKRAAEQKL